MTSDLSTRRGPLSLPCTNSTARSMATAKVLDLLLSRGAIGLVLLASLPGFAAYFDDRIPRASVATGVVFLATGLASFWLNAVNAARLRAAPGTDLTTSYRPGTWVLAGHDGEEIFGRGTARARRLIGTVVLKRPHRRAVVVPAALVTQGDLEFLTGSTSSDPEAAGTPDPWEVRYTLRKQDQDHLVRAARTVYVRGPGVTYLVCAALIVPLSTLLAHRPASWWWVAFYLYLWFLGWLAVGRDTAFTNPIGTELVVTVRDDALDVLDPGTRRVVRYVDVRRLDLHHDVIVLRRRGVPAVLVPMAALPDDALARMRAAFVSLES